MRALIKVLDARLNDRLPSHATPHAAGMDLHACIEGQLILAPGDTVLIPTGFSMAVPVGYAALLVPRSGLGHKLGVVLGNLVGVIDADFRGQVMVSLWNRGQMRVNILPMDRIAQMLIVPVARVEWKVVDELEETYRGSGGFGSTG